MLAVDPDRRATGLLVGLTLLALLVGVTAVALGVATWTAPGAFDAPEAAQPGLAPPPPSALVDGAVDCGGTTVQGTWSVPDGSPARALRVVVLSAEGAPLASGPVAADGVWSLPLPAGLSGTGGVVLLAEGRGPLASAPLLGC